MPHDPHEHHRQSIRLGGYDYTNAGMYFVTICVDDQSFLFGRIAGEAMVLSAVGQIILRTWEELPSHYTGVEVDRFVVMPNHVHGIIVLTTGYRGPGVVPFREGPRHVEGQKVLSLGDVVMRFKSLAYTAYRKNTGISRSFWQKNYYEHIIRDGQSLGRVRYYIMNNPRRWRMDPENPSHEQEDPIAVWLRTMEDDADDGANGRGRARGPAPT